MGSLSVISTSRMGSLSVISTSRMRSLSVISTSFRGSLSVISTIYTGSHPRHHFKPSSLFYYGWYMEWSIIVYDIGRPLYGGPSVPPVHDTASHLPCLVGPWDMSQWEIIDIIISSRVSQSTERDTCGRWGTQANCMLLHPDIPGITDGVTPNYFFNYILSKANFLTWETICIRTEGSLPTLIW
jgi:hypothetical protein